MSNNTHFLGDNPISKSEEDLFNFKYYAEKIQRLIQLNSSNSEPFTIGIYGKWGEGKTSFLNLIENKVDHFEKNEGDKEYLKFHFNPWRFSNEDEMLFDFFDELSKKFYVNKNTNLQLAGKWISKYSKYLKAIKISSTNGIPKKFGSVSFDISEVFKALGEDLSGENITLESLKNKVNEAIVKANFKVVVFIDDLDRLDKNEIYSILKLIKLNANFSNFIFIVNLDSEQVAKAIKERYGSDVEDGNLFLEKIINIPIHLPKIEKEDLQYFFDIKLQKIISSLFFLDDFKKSEVFKEISVEFLEGNYKSPREILRVLNSFFISAFALQEEVNLKDLFWIEWLKIRNEDMYNIIKNYNINRGLDAVFTNQHETINFNDDFTKMGITPNGTRKKLIELFPENEWFLNKIFPTGKIDINDAGFIPYINISEHFEKYFSFHTIRKVSNIKLEQMEVLVKDRKTDDLKSLIVELFDNDVQQQKIIYKIERFIGIVSFDNGRDFFFDFLFDNLKLITDSQEDMFGVDNKSRIIELVAKILDSDSVNDNQKICLELGEKLNVYELCYFVRKFKEDKVYKKDLEVLISKKANEEFSIQNPFYNDPKNNPNKMIMHYWKLGNSLDFEEYIKATLVNIDRIKSLIRNFPGFWNNSYFGGLEEDNYEHMKRLIDLDFVYEKIFEFSPELIEKIDIATYEFSRSDESTLEENLEQFIYWYKKEQRKKLLLLGRK